MEAMKALFFTAVLIVLSFACCKKSEEVLVPALKPGILQFYTASGRHGPDSTRFYGWATAGNSPAATAVFGIHYDFTGHGNDYFTQLTFSFAKKPDHSMSYLVSNRVMTDAVVISDYIDVMAEAGQYLEV